MILNVRFILFFLALSSFGLSGPSLLAPSNDLPQNEIRPPTAHSLVTAAFSASTDTICQGDTVHFTNLSTGGSTYAWSLNSPTNVRSTAFNYDWIPTFSGAVTIYLQAFNSTCSALDSMVIQVNPLPSFPHLGPDQQICTGDTLVLNPFFNHTSSILWSDSSSGLSFSTTQSGWIWVESGNGCAVFRDSLELSLSSPPTATIGGSMGPYCVGDTVFFNNQGTLSQSYNWSILPTGDTLSTSPSFHWYPIIPGTYTLVLEANNAGCIDQDSAVVQVSNPPLFPYLGPDDQICDGDSVRLIPSLNPNTTVVWSDGSMDSTLTVTQDGGHWVEVSTACRSLRDSMYLEVIPVPIPMFTHSHSGLAYQFTDGTATGNQTWNWDFGDGSLGSMQQNPSHTYANDGTYTVCLTVDRQGCIDSTCEVISAVMIEIDPSLAQQLVVYPNPAQDRVVVSGQELTGFTLFDLAGKALYREQELAPKGKLSLSVLPYPNGIYFLEVASKQGSARIKIRVQR